MNQENIKSILCEGVDEPLCMHRTLSPAVENYYFSGLPLATVIHFYKPKFSSAYAEAIQTGVTLRSN
jgi:hypothetical protein